MGSISCHKTYSWMWCFLNVAAFATTLLQCELSMGCSFFKAWLLTLLWCLAGAAGWKFPLSWSSMGCRETSACSSPWAVEESLFRCVGEEVLSFFSDLSVCRNVSLTLSHSSLPAAAYWFLLFLKCVITEAPPASLMVSALGNSGDWLELVLSNTETVPDLFSQRPHLHRPLVT